MRKRRNRPNQLSLPIFEQHTASVSPEGSIESKVARNHIPASESTFKSGLTQEIHRWFRLTPSFGPELVDEMLDALECGPEDVVLDPFAGAGTTMIQCQLQGTVSFGYEINPFLCFVGDTSLNWGLDPVLLRRDLEAVSNLYRETKAELTLDNLAKFGLEIPRIHNPTRWWRPDILANLIALRYAIDQIVDDPPSRDFFRLGLAGALVPELTNVTLGRLQLHFIEREGDEIRVLETFRARIHDMIDDLEMLHDKGWTRTSHVYMEDSTHVKQAEPSHSASCVITSPPYPNRYSYVWNTRPHLYFLEFFHNASQAASLDKVTIGGTWGSATSDLVKGVVESDYPIVQEVVWPLAQEIRKSSNLMANYAMKYFNLLAQHFLAINPLLEKDARLAYVVGCSRLKGVYIETDVLLGKIVEGLGLGFEVTAIERFRRRHSGKDLFEAIVYARRGGH